MQLTVELYHLGDLFIFSLGPGPTPRLLSLEILKSFLADLGREGSHLGRNPFPINRTVLWSVLFPGRHQVLELLVL